jgi:hypothetical protein
LRALSNRKKSGVHAAVNALATSCDSSKSTGNVYPAERASFASFSGASSGCVSGSFALIATIARSFAA